MNNKIISKVVAGTLLFSMVGYTLPVFAYTKEETVYSKLDSTGNNYKTIVSTHLKNNKNEELLDDLSDLIGIKNTSGDETFTQDGNKITWNANKNDIYYQGESSKELPVECNVKYELDGNEISAQELAGKSGKLKITLNYTNKEERYVTINGRKVKMYVPFVVVAGTIIKNDKATNVEITSGKVVDDGTKTIIMGMAMPGLQESLGVSKNDIEIPNNIEITMDVTDFESQGIVSYVTPKVLEESDLTVFNKLDQLYSKVSTLQDSMNKIEDGANILAQGTTKLTDGTTELKNGTTSAYNGASQISSEVSKSIKTLSADKSDALDEKTLESIGQQAASQSTLTEEQKKQIIAAADSGIEAQADTIKAQAIASAKQVAEATALKTALTVAQTTAKTTAISTAKQLNPKLTEEQLNAIGEQAVSNVTLTDAQKAQIKAQADAGIDAQKETIGQQGIASAKQIAEKTAITSAQAGATAAAKATATKVASTVGNQVKTAASQKVISQMKTLSSGLNQLTTGLSTLNSGAEQLQSGATELKNGAETLATGITTYNEEGIKKICNYIQGDAKNLTNRIKALSNLSKEYSNFSMLSDGNEGEVQFITIIDAIKKQEQSEKNKTDIIIEDNKNE